MRSERQAQLLAMLVLGLLLTGFFGLFAGDAPLGFHDVLKGLLGTDERFALIVREIRLPRVLLGILVGASLGVSGAALQGLLRNPLADPGVLGLTAFAGLGASSAIAFGVAFTHPFAIPAAAFMGALAATAVLFELARRGASVLTLVLAGAGLSSLAVALTSLILNLSPSAAAVQDMVLWMLGSLSNRSMDDVLMAAPFCALGFALLAFAPRAIDALTLGEDAARSLGVDLERLRLVIIAGTALCAGASVAAAGSIAFVGLIVPHAVRRLAGGSPGAALLPSALLGAILILAADMLTRLPGGVDLKLGVVTALVGAPLFLALLWRTGRTMS